MLAPSGDPQREPCSVTPLSDLGRSPSWTVEVDGSACQRRSPIGGRRSKSVIESARDRDTASLTSMTAAPREGDDGTADIGGRRGRTKGEREGYSCWLGA